MKSEKEAVTRAKYINPQLSESGWDVQFDTLDLEYPITAGQIVPEGKKGTRKSILRADYVMQLDHNYKIAVVEAKAIEEKHDSGMQQAIRYAEKLNLKFAYSTNGKKIEEYDFITKKQTTIDRFPTKQELRDRLKDHNNFDDNQMDILSKPFERSSRDPTGRIIEPRYYQEIAINSAISAILAGKKRVLLSLATGTGKTFIAYQIARKLYDTNNPTPKILFLADRDALLNQAKNMAFEPFGEARHRIKRKIETAYEMYFTLYQALDVDKEDGELYKQYDKDYFDYIIIDECHRGTSDESGNWRGILNYFSSATHIGMTATPRIEKENRDTYDYFGAPVYEYSLKQGIEDGFLAPYMIHRVNLEIDEMGYTPKPGERDLNGNILESGKTYGYKDFDRTLIVNKRRKTVAKNLIKFMEKNGKMNKAILFCQNTEHARAMTKLIRNYSGEKYNYCVTIVSAEGEVGKEHLEKFQTPNKDFPVIAVTSKLLSTGIDVPTCQVIALDKSINSLIEFKQIIGRGTRVLESKNKWWFSIIDYRKTTRLFEDPDWDGMPIEVTEEEQKTITEEKQQRENDTQIDDTQLEVNEGDGDIEDSETVETYHVEGNKVRVIGEQVYIYDPIQGKKLLSYTDYTGREVKRLVNDDEMQLYKIWTDSDDKRPKFIAELKNRGITIKHLRQITETYTSDPFDLLLHFAFNTKAKTRYERVDNLRKKAFLEKYPEKAREVLDVILDHYADEGYEELEGRELLKLDKFNKFGGAVDIITKKFETVERYDSIIKEIVKELYVNN